MTILLVACKRLEDCMALIAINFANCKKKKFLLIPPTDAGNCFKTLFLFACMSVKLIRANPFCTILLPNSQNTAKMLYDKRKQWLQFVRLCIRRKIVTRKMPPGSVYARTENTWYAINANTIVARPFLFYECKKMLLRKQSRAQAK